MGFISVNPLVVAIVTFALLATAATTTTAGFPYPVTAAAEIIETSFATSNPIRTVVTVNSNRVDVLAADEKDVPKVLEKLRELCAGPFASLYPEICEHLGAAGAGGDLDLDGLDEIIWGPTKDATPQVATATRKGVDEAWSEPPSARPLSTSLAEETGSIEESQRSSSEVSESAPADTSRPFLVTFTVPAEIKTTKTYQVVVHEVTDTRVPTTATVDDGQQTSTVAKPQVPTTFETKTKPNSAELAPSEAEAEAENKTDKTIPITNPSNEAGKAISTTDKSGEDNKHVQVSTTGGGDLGQTTNTDAKSEQDITTEAKSETDYALSSTAIASIESESEAETAIPTSQAEKTVLITSVSTNYVSVTDAPNVPDGPETTLECPWKTGDEGEEEGPGPCTVVTIWHYGTITLPPGVTPNFSIGPPSFETTGSPNSESFGLPNPETIGPSNPEFRPVFTPTASPRPSRTRTSFDVTLPSPPSTDSDSPPLWFATLKAGCTQTVSLVSKNNDPFTSTIYPETVTSTAFISCSCPNLATEYIVRHGITIIPRTTVTVLEPTTKKVVHCSASTSIP